MMACFPPQAVLRQRTFVYDPLDGFAFVTMLGAVIPWSSGGARFADRFVPHDLVDHAKAARGCITDTINAVGSIYHVLTNGIELEAGVSMTAVSHRGTTMCSPARLDVMVDAATWPSRPCSPPSFGCSLSAPSRRPLMPSASVMTETLPGIAFTSWLGLAMAPATSWGSSSVSIGRCATAPALPEVEKRLAEAGNVATLSTPEEKRKKSPAITHAGAGVIAATCIAAE